MILFRRPSLLTPPLLKERDSHGSVSCGLPARLKAGRTGEKITQPLRFRHSQKGGVQLTEQFRGRDRYLRKISNRSDRKAVYRKPNPNELMMKSAEDWVWTNDSSRLNRARDWRNLGERPTRIFSGHLGRAIFNLIRGLANSCYAVQCALKSELPGAHSLRSWRSFFAVLGVSMRFQFWS